MPDNLIKIGAMVSTDGLQEGMATSVETVKAATRDMGVSFQEMSSKAQASAAAANRAFTSISADTRAAAAGLSEQALKEATLAKARIAANTEVRTSIRLMNNEQFDAARATALYASATQKVVALDAEIAAAHTEAARAAAAAAEEAKLSSNVWVASMQRIALAAKESFAQVQEMMAGTMERANLTASGIRFGFSGLSELMGGALVVGFAGEALDDLAKMNNELDHLHVETGINITSLAGLQQIVKGMQGDFEPISRGLVRLARAQVQAAEATTGTNQMRMAFNDLGITLQEVEHLSPEQMLYRVSRAIAANGNTAVVANSALSLFGRGGAALIPVLKEQGDNLEKNMKLQGDATGITEKSAEAARRWTVDLAALEAELRRGLIPVLEYMPDILRGIEGDFLLLKAVLQTVFEGMAIGVLAVAKNIGGLGKIVRDVATGDFYSIVADSEAMKNSIVDIWKGGASDIKNAWKEVNETFTGAPPKIPGINDVLGGSDLSGLERPAKGKKDHAAEDRIHAMEEEYSELEQAHKLTLKEEHDFWEARIGEFANGTEQYRQIAAKLGQIDQSGAKAAAEIIKKFKTDQAKEDGVSAPKQTEFAKEILQQAEDITRSGERWREYNATLVRGLEIEASVKASLEEARLKILESTGGIEELGAAQARARIHTEEHTAALKALQDELAALAIQAAGSAKDPLTGALLDPQLAARMSTLQNQITQEKGRGQAQGVQDTAALHAAIAKPYLTAFQAIDAGWKKVQTDLINGNKNIARDFAQMGVNLVQHMAMHFEEIIAKHIAMWIKMQVAHQMATQAGVAIDAAGAAQSDGISMLSALKQLNHAAAVAAGKAWSAMAGIPVVGPELGAIAAAVTYAGVMALAAFEKGGVVGGSPGMAVPILAHGGERVLTSQQTNNFERLVNNSSHTGGSNSVRANVTQHFHGGGASSAKETRAAVQSLMRRGKLSY